MKRIILTVLLTILIVLFIEGVGWTIFVFIGAYNVTQLNHDNGFVDWWLDHGTNRSVKKTERPNLYVEEVLERG